MSGLLIFLHLFFLGAPIHHESGPAQLISCHFQNLAFPAFCDSVEKKSGVKIFFQKEWVKSIRVTLNNDSISVESAVSQAINGSKLEVSVWHNNLVLLPGEHLLSTIPEFEQKAAAEKETVKSKSLTESEERYLTGRKADVMKTIKIGKAGTMKPGNKATILGRIFDLETGEAVIGVTMYIEETKSGSVSDLNGYLSIVLKPGKYNAVFKYLGFEKQKYLLEVLSDGDFSITMKKPVIQMKEIVVYGDRQVNIKSKDPGLDKISIKSIKEMPMLMGERDILKVSQMMPGIVSVGEGAAGLNVRGGSSDQNAFYINKIPVYNTSHLFGFFPAFNADIIKDFSIYKGHIPAKYGGRLSSVFSIVTRQGNRKKFTMHGGLSPVAGNLVVEGPLKKDSSSIILSARSSYSDWILKRIEDPTISRSSANFNDFTAAANYDLKKSQLSVFIYHSKDHFRLADKNDYEYSNNGASVNMNHNFNSSLRGEFSIIASGYTFKTIDENDLSAAYSQSYAINHYEARADFSHVTSYRNTMEYGLGVILYRLNRGTVEPYGLNSMRSPINLGKEQGVESSIYFSDIYDLFPWMNVSIGLRSAIYTPAGEKTVYTYAAGNPLDVRYIEDTLNFKSGKIIKTYTEPDLRAAVNIVTDQDGTIKLAFNQMHQNLFMLSNTITIAPNTQWKLADYHIKPSQSQQFSLGIFRSLPKGGWETSVEFFYKTTQQYPEFKDGADFLNNPQVETAVLQGKQKAYGVEIFLKRSRKTLDGWISYTYSRSLIHVTGVNSWDKINEGDVYPANYDIPHVFNAVINFHMSRRYTLSSVFSYQQGKPVTYPTSIYYINGNPYVDYSKRNEYRIPDYFRTDLSLTLEGNLKKKKLVHSSFIMSLYNLTGRQNPYSVYFTSESGKIRSYQYSVIGVPIFTITWIFKLGNYASE